MCSAVQCAYVPLCVVYCAVQCSVAHCASCLASQWAGYEAAHRLCGVQCVVFSVQCVVFSVQRVVFSVQ